MKSVRLGRTELLVSRIAFGGIPIQRLTEDEAIEVVRRCLDLGVTFLDTANAYSTSEERIGKAVAGRREQVIIATKTGARDRAGAEAHLALSLKRLQTDYVDLWQFHNISTPEQYEQVLGPGGAMEAAQDALRAGKVRHVGITCHSLDAAIKAVPSGHFETVQVPFNFITNEPADELLPLCIKHDVGFIAMKPFAGGMLDDAKLAIRYLMQFPNVVPDPGIQLPEEIEEIVAIANDDHPLTPAEEARYEQIREEVGNLFCRRCGYCLPCPEGINIPLVLGVTGNHKRMPKESLTSPGTKGAVDNARQCIECGECEEKCPYLLPIREMLVEHIELYDRVIA